MLHSLEKGGKKDGTPKNIKASRIYRIKNSPQFDCLKKGQKCRRLSTGEPSAQKKYEDEKKIKNAASPD